MIHADISEHLVSCKGDRKLLLTEALAVVGALGQVLKPDELQALGTLLMMSEQDRLACLTHVGLGPQQMIKIVLPDIKGGKSIG